MVKELRELTGLGMMECKKALTEAGGDLKKAEELLRIKSGAKASKAAGRVAAEGAIGTYLSADGKLGALVEVNCETDFVAKNADFVAFAQARGRSSSPTKNPADVAALSQPHARRRDGRGRAPEAGAEDRREHHHAPLRARARRRASSSQYVHPGAKIGVLVDYEGDDGVAKDVAMHIAFAKPQVHVEGPRCPADVVAARAQDPRGARRRIRQAAGDRRQDGRGRHQQVPRRESRCSASRS